MSVFLSGRAFLAADLRPPSLVALTHGLVVVERNLPCACPLPAQSIGPAARTQAQPERWKRPGNRNLWSLDCFAPVQPHLRVCVPVPSFIYSRNRAARFHASEISSSGAGCWLGPDINPSPCSLQSPQQLRGAPPSAPPVHAPRSDHRHVNLHLLDVAWKRWTNNVLKPLGCVASPPSAASSPALPC
jgi:hypothetical protein